MNENTDPNYNSLSLYQKLTLCLLAILGFLTFGWNVYTYEWPEAADPTVGNVGAEDEASEDKAKLGDQSSGEDLEVKSSTIIQGNSNFVIQDSNIEGTVVDD